MLYLDQPGLDVFIVQELWKCEKFLSEELISEIDSCIHYSTTVCSDGVGNVADVDGVQMLVVWCTLNENLEKNKIYKGYISCILILSYLKVKVNKKIVKKIVF